VKAVILAAGRGSRMDTLTKDHPKCLIDFCGKTLLERQLDALRRAGIRETALVTGYLSECLRGRGSKEFENPLWSQSNMVSSLLCADPWLREDTCVVSYSDIVYTSETVSQLIASPGSIVITYDLKWQALWQARFTDPLKDAETFVTDPKGRLIEIGRRATKITDIKGQYMGLLKFNPSGWALVKKLLGHTPETEVRAMDMTSLLGRLIAAGEVVDTVPIEDPWCEIDSLSDLELCRRLPSLERLR